MSTATDIVQGKAALRHYTISRALRELFPDAKLRAGFRAQPYLETVTVGEVLASGLSTEKFFSECRALPSCGEVQIKRLRSILEDLSAQMAGEHPSAPQVRGANALPFRGSLYPDFVSAWESVYQRIWRLAHFEEFVYMPSSVPEFMKSPAVLRAELGPNINLTKYLEGLSSLRNSQHLNNQATGLVVLDRTRLDMLFARQGVYAALSPTDLENQRARMVHMLENVSTGIEFKVLDTEAAHLSCATIMGELVTLAVMGGYLVTQDAPLAQLLANRAKAAAQTGISLSEYLAAK
jgi:hypothetical protein